MLAHYGFGSMEESDEPSPTNRPRPPGMAEESICPRGTSCQPDSILEKEGMPLLWQENNPQLGKGISGKGGGSAGTFASAFRASSTLSLE